MFDKILEIKDEVISRVKKIGLVKGLEIGSGVAAILGLILIAGFSGDDILASDIVEEYENTIDIKDAVIEDVETDKTDEQIKKGVS